MIGSDFLERLGANREPGLANLFDAMPPYVWIIIGLTSQTRSKNFVFLPGSATFWVKTRLPTSNTPFANIWGV